MQFSTFTQTDLRLAFTIMNRLWKLWTERKISVQIEKIKSIISVYLHNISHYVSFDAAKK